MSVPVERVCALRVIALKNVGGPARPLTGLLEGALLRPRSAPLEGPPVD